MNLHNFSIKTILIILLIYTVCVFCAEKCQAFELSDIWNKPFSSYIIGVNLGKETRVFERWDHSEKGYSVEGASWEFIKKLDKRWDFGLEWNANNHTVYGYDYTDYFSTMAIRLWLTRNFLTSDCGTFYSGLGAGLGIIDTRKRESCRHLGTSGVIGQLGFRLGYKIYFDWGNLRLEYMIDHFSDPLDEQNGESKSDAGINYDTIKAVIEIPF